MKYNFDKITDRRGTNSLKYDFAAENGKPADALAMWVADMDFAAPPEVTADLRRAVSSGIFGYSDVKTPYYDALTAWFSERFGFVFSRRDVVKTPGVVFALATAVKAYSEVYGGVLIQTPVYYPFYSVISRNSREIIENPLIYKDGVYTIDFDDFERKIAENNVKLFILCSPHNPVGRVWTRRELVQIRDICVKYNVIVISDEIHCDFVYSGHVHTNYAALDENAVICTAPSKTFNLAGLQTANIVIKNVALRSRFKAELSKTGYGLTNSAGLIACQSAYANGGEWLGELLVYLSGNIELTRTFLAEYLPRVRLVAPEGTYLLWLDFSAYDLAQSVLDARVEHGAMLWLDSGTKFGGGGAGVMRMNIACPRGVLRDALARLAAEFG